MASRVPLPRLHAQVAAVLRIWVAAAVAASISVAALRDLG